ncbi:MAG: biotin synthase BioB [Kiritimatiellia bacterium]
MADELTAAEAARRIIAGGEVTQAEMRRLVKAAPREELFAAAHRVTEAFKAETFDFCAILNARSGRCPENCKWCAQSAHWKTSCETWGLKPAAACVAAAREAEANGAVRFALVTSGRTQTPADLAALCAVLREIRAATGIHRCASLGLLDAAAFAQLKAAGLERYHCNLETAPSRFPALCSTHTVAEKLATLKAAKEAGLQVCCGGILGMGETVEELVEFAFALKEIAPDSIPVNVLHPIPGTPLGERPILAEEEFLRDVAVLRLVNPRTSLRFAGGRRDMSDATAARAIFVGISAGIAGPLLTTPGAVFADDRQLALEAGYQVPAARSL